MQYDFDEVIERRGTGALKYEALLPRWGRDDLIPLWVADMDFRTPPFIMEAIRRRCEHEILGYTVKPRAFFEAIRAWVDRRHGWKVNASEIGFAPGIVPGISSAIQCFTEPGDKIMIQPPVYHPFAMIIRENGREIVNNPLILENGRYRMDFNHMQEAVRGCRMFILWPGRVRSAWISSEAAYGVRRNCAAWLKSVRQTARWSFLMKSMRI